MTRYRTTFFLVFLLGGLLLGGLQPSLAAWQEPSSTTPPAGNIPAPLTVGNNNQAKAGKLCVGGACSLGPTIQLEVKGATDVQRDLIVDKNLTVSTNSLFVDSTAHKVAIGATTGLTGQLTVIAGPLQGVSVTSAAGMAAVNGASTTSTGVKGETRAPVSVTLPAGVSAKATSATPGVGVHGRTTLGFGVYGVTLAGAAVFGEAIPPSNPAAGYGVYGENLNAAGGTGVSGQGRATGVYARAECMYAGSCAGYLGPEYSLVAEAPTSGNRRYGLYAEQPDVDPAFPLRFAGYFAGAVRAGTNAPTPSFGDPNAIPEVIGQQFLQTAVRPSILPFSAGQIVSSTPAGTGYKMAFDGTNIWKTNAGNGLDKYRTDGTSLGSFAVAPAGQSIWGLVYDGTYIWTANNGGGAGSVSRVLAADPTQFTQFTVGFGSVTKYIAFDGKYIWVTDSQVGGTLKKVDRSSGVVLQTVALGGLPTGITFDGTYLWVIDFAARDVKKVRASDGTIVATVTLGGTAFYSAFDGRFLWVPIVDNKQVKKIDPSTNTVVATYDLSVITVAPRDVLFDGTYIWITDNWITGKVIQMLAADGSIVKTISVATLPSSLAFDGTSIYVDPANFLTKIASGNGFGVPDLSKVVLLKPSAAQNDSINLSGTATVGGNATVTGDLIVNANVWGGASDTVLNSTVWTNTGDLAGATRVDSLVRASNGYLYAGTYPNGDVFRSTDGGWTWTNTQDFASGPSTTVFSLLADGTTIYAAMNNSLGVYKTTNNGVTWQSTGSIPNSVGVDQLVLSRDGITIFAATVGTALLDNSLYKTINGGTSWQLVNSFPGLAASSVSFFEASDGTLYFGKAVAGAESDVYVSTNGGASWTATPDLPNVNIAVWNLIEGPAGTVYAATGQLGRVYRTTNGGASWTDVASGPIDPSFPGHVYNLVRTSAGTLYAGTGSQGNVYSSTNNGTTWSNTPDLAGATNVRSLMLAPDGTLFAGTSPNGDVFQLPVSLACPSTMLQKGVKVDVALKLIESHCRTL